MLTIDHANSPFYIFHLGCSTVVRLTEFFYMYSEPKSLYTLGRVLFTVTTHM